MSDPNRLATAPATERTATRAPSVGISTEETTDGGGSAPTFAPSAAPGELGRLGKYRIVKELGHGGMGAVYLAFDDRLQRKIALKVMLPKAAADATAKERFLREARAAAQISSDHVVNIHEAEEIDGIPYIALQYLQGYPLDRYLQKKGNLDIPQALRIARETALGLAAAHDLGLIHRDIKPGNLWLEAPNGRVKILDFGLAKPVNAAGETEITASGAVMGTPAYMAPEQGLGQPVDGRADLFSLGCVLYRLVTGRLPFDRPTLMGVLTAIATEEPTPVRELNPQVQEPLAQLIRRLMAKNPAHRPPNAQAVADELNALIRPLSPGDGSAPPVVYYAPAAVSIQQSNPFTELGEANAPAAPLREPTAAVKAKKPLPWLLIGSAFAFLAACVVAGVIIIKITNKDGTVTEIKASEGSKIEVDGKTVTPGATKTPDPVRPIGPFPPTFKNSIGMEFVKVPKGTGWLGGGAGKQGETKVVIEQDFYLGKYEVTQEEWEAVTGQNPSHFSRKGEGKDAVMDIPDADLKRFPVENVTWDDCQLFIKKLNEKEKESGWVYRLPKEAEWEYACRGGPVDKSDSAFDFYLAKPTNELLPNQANFAPEQGKGLQRTCKVGSYEPNLLGSYDMHGNVGEWCDDVVGAEVAGRVLLGGDWGWDVVHARAAVREATVTTHRTLALGLRVARVPVSPADSVPATTDADRKAAEWVLSVGGSLSVRVNGEDRWIKTAAELPKGWLALSGVELYFNTKVSDAGLVAFKGCKNLTHLNLGGTKVTDAGTVHFQDCKGLTYLMLGHTAVTDAGLAAFKGCNRLTHLDLNGLTMQPVTDVGLAHFQGCKGLTNLNLRGAKMTDVGLAYFKDCKGLTDLSLEVTPTTDAGLATFRECKGLTSLNMIGTKVTDAGLENLKDCKNLTALYLADTQVTDAGVAHLKDFKGLAQLSLGNSKVTDAGLAHLKELKGLAHLSLYATQVSDAGLERLKELKGLTHLDLGGTGAKMTDAGLAHIKELKDLTVLHLKGTKVTVKGLEALHAALPRCKIEHDGGVVEPKVVADPDRKAAFKNTLGMEFVKVPKGTGWLGGGAGKPGETKVVIEQDFYLGKYEVTQEDWEAVTGQNPSHFSRKGAGKDAVKDIPDADLKRFPVEMVSWDDCQLFIKRLNEKEKDTGWVYRLPKEEESEYACRGGPVDKLDSAFDFYFAKPTNSLLMNLANFSPENYGKGGLGRPCKVGSYESNTLGMHDMHGNIHEHCDNAKLAAGGVSLRVSWGGGWDGDSEICRTAARHAYPPSARSKNTGLRLARVPVGPDAK